MIREMVSMGWDRLLLCQEDVVGFLWLPYLTSAPYTNHLMFVHTI